MGSLGAVSVTVDVSDVLVGVVVGRLGHPGAAPGGVEGLDLALRDAFTEARTRSDAAPVVAEVRGLLRYGKYKPTGRGKPASEYLLNAAREDRFPRISTLVDINNLVSLRSLLPISLVDIDRAETVRFSVRRGRPGESYVFNAAGQVIDLEDLLLTSRLPEDRPCANPVKDSMDTKLTEISRTVLAVLYATPALGPRLAEATAEFGRALEGWAGASEVATEVLGYEPSGH